MVQVKIFEFVGVANLATRQRMELSETLNGVSFWLLPLGFPRGEAAGLDGTSEPASPADEGWRALKNFHSSTLNGKN